MKRGDFVTIVISGAYGKPRPAVVIQADAFAALTSVTVLLLTSEVMNSPHVRITLEPSNENGLRRRSQVMVDRAMTLPRAKVGPVFGTLERETLRTISRAVAAFLALDDDIA